MLVINRVILEKDCSFDIFTSRCQILYNDETIDSPISRDKYVPLLKTLFHRIYLRSKNDGDILMTILTDDNTYQKYVDQSLVDELKHIIKEYIEENYLPDFLK